MTTKTPLADGYRYGPPEGESGIATCSGSRPAVRTTDGHVWVDIDDAGIWFRVLSTITRRTFRGLADVVPEWVTDCTHDPVCGLEPECRDLQRDEAAADRAEEKRDDR